MRDTDRSGPNSGQSLAITSDVHFGRDVDRAILEDFSDFISRHSGHEIVLAGDIFELSLEPRGHDLPGVLRELLRKNDPARRALREHVARGGALTFLPGNHDAELTEPAARPVLLEALELTDSAPVSVAPWFIRRGKVHIEHGHLYDRDNAPVHPLVHSHSAEPLGIALTRRFISPNAATHFLHAHQTTPLGGFIDAWRLYGLRAPIVIANYFRTAGTLCLEAGSGRRREADVLRRVGAERLGPAAEGLGVRLDALEALVEGAPKPRHLSGQELFMRLYFDRVIATVLGTVGTAAAWATFGGVVARRLWITAASYLAANVLATGSRYGEDVVAALREGARHVAELTGAELVIFGHTHTIDEAPRYLNAGSFAYPAPEGRPYLIVHASGSAERRYLPARSPGR